MCGLTAEFAYGDSAAPVLADNLGRISAAMASRGPDGAGLWISADSRVGLAHRRLAIVDLSDAGAQPMATSDGALRITFNGEIYNFRTLRAELEDKGYRFRSQSDTEVLLYLYQEHGREMVHRLRGMYAFALWDERERAMFLARDPLGIKPLYYADDGACLRVASQVKALCAGYRTYSSAEPAGHVGFFLWGHVPEPWTLYKGIRALPAGSALWVQQGRRANEAVRYFELSAELAKIEAISATMTAAEARERFAAALAESISLHMLADVPVGAFLSSGLDSTSIAALASEHSPERLRTITLGFAEFKGSPNDETPLAETIAEQFGFAHSSRWIGREDFAGAHNRFLTAMDQPTIDGLNTFLVSKAAREAGLKVALSGLGGDELLAGYSTFTDVPRLVRCAKPFSVLGRGFRWISAPLLRHFTSPKYASLLEYGSTHGGAYLLRRGLYMPWELPHMLDGDLVREGWRDLATMAHLEATIAGVATSRLRVTALEMAWYMRNQLLRDTDWASMTHSLEVRVPLVDLVLLREVAKLVVAGRSPRKADMARCLPRPLPRIALTRPKTGFSVPVREWLDGEDRTQARGLRGWAQAVYRHFADN